jgi:hypothetical protein
MTVVTSVVGVWNVVANGWSGQLNISSVDAQGNLVGTLTITTDDAGNQSGEAATAISGYWDADAQEVWFVRDMSNIHPGDSLPFQIYTGYAYGSIALGTSSTGLSGFFEAFLSADSHRFGWTASQARVS